MRGIPGPDFRFPRRFRSAIWVAPLALVLSCADMPNAPKKMVHVQGTILDKNGQGMFATTLYFLNEAARIDQYSYDPAKLPPGEEPSYYGVTQSDGTYDVTIPEGDYRILAYPIPSSGYARLYAPSIHVGESGAQWNYRFSWPTLTIRAENTSGAPIPSSEAYLSSITDSYDPSANVSVQAALQGGALKAVLPQGRYRLDVSPGGYSSGYLDWVSEVEVSADTTITTTHGGYIVQARVLGQGGLPMENAYVRALFSESSAEAKTDAAGIALFHLPAGGYTWTVAAPVSYIVPRLFQYAAINGDATIDFSLSGTEWTGVVRRTGDGTPMPGFVVYVQSIGSGSASSQTDALGRFRLIVQPGLGYQIGVIDTQTGDRVATLPGVAAGADSTFDIYVDVPTP